ncbi:hypothetical protein [Streptantibioticus silvisoli]|uniref:Uncharacterized protein n=1 Tax=Streptantibioticus silvisoli TaxID=2705255 RepID=A0ABT6W6S1_9ACTN|nr:hypothetical protein [Streptantibioticus silvisoli]MDI5966447.1 hypothetical protein [Streptantibioticus silvisoli]
MTDSRCAAAHSTDPSPCEGPHDAVLIRERRAVATRKRTGMGGVAITGRADLDGVPGCVHHGARLLASMHGGHAYPGPSNDTGREPGDGAATEAYRRAKTLKPFDWVTRGDTA